jgi:putative membrane protein
MLTKNRYSIKDLLIWTRIEIFGFLIYSCAFTFLYEVFDFGFLKLPWTPIALVGTAVAFMIGFQNNSAYGRIWEARKIWGGIVNISRSWTMKMKVMINNDHAEKQLSQEEIDSQVVTIVYRHIAWMTALRHALRQKKPWEEFEDHKTNREWSQKAFIPEKITKLEDDLLLYLSEEERKYVLSKNNKAAAVLFFQSKHIAKLKDSGHIWEFSFLDLQNLLQQMFTLQGKAERIKNFPYPRQYATLSYYFVRLFLILIPFGLIPEFDKLGLVIAEYSPIFASHFVWIAIPFCACVSWVFHTMERIGRVGENPFEGSANDVPISTISRGIEIDIRQLIDERLDQIPSQFPEKLNVQM